MLKIFIKGYLAIILMLAFSSNAISRDISYEFFQVNYVDISGSNEEVTNPFPPISRKEFDLDGSGFEFSFSKSMSDHVALTFGLGTASIDKNERHIYEDFYYGERIYTYRTKTRNTEFNIGITAHSPITSNTDFVFNASLVSVETEKYTRNTETGSAIGIGIRNMATDSIELELGMTRINLDDENENSFGIGVRFYANDFFSIGLGYTTDEDSTIDSLVFSLRINANQR